MGSQMGSAEDTRDVKTYMQCLGAEGGGRFELIPSLGYSKFYHWAASHWDVLCWVGQGKGEQGDGALPPSQGKVWLEETMRSGSEANHLSQHHRREGLGYGTAWLAEVALLAGTRQQLQQPWLNWSSQQMHVLGTASLGCHMNGF